MFVCKLRTTSCSHYEHFHVYLIYRRQTRNVVTRQAFDWASIFVWSLHKKMYKKQTKHFTKYLISNIVSFMCYIVECDFKFCKQKLCFTALDLLCIGLNNTSLPSHAKHMPSRQNLITVIWTLSYIDSASRKIWTHRFH